MTDKDQSRADFEVWAISEFISVNRSLDGTDGYFEGDSQIAWNAWQAALNHKAADATPTTEESSGVAPAVPPMTFINKDFYWDSAKQHHVPTLYIEFTPVPANSPNDAPGWVDRDRLAAMLEPAPPPPKEQT